MPARGERALINLNFPKIYIIDCIWEMGFEFMFNGNRESVFPYVYGDGIWVSIILQGHGDAAVAHVKMT